SAASGDTSIESGGVATLGNSGTVSLITGTCATAGDTGPIALTTGPTALGATGDIILTTGVATTIQGGIIHRGFFTSKYQAVPGGMTTTATIDEATLVKGLIVGNHAAGATQNYTLPTGVALAAILPATFTTGDAIDFSIINTSAALVDTITVVASVGITIVGKALIGSANAAATDNSTGLFRVKCTGAGTFICYRIG
ncbi:MAG: hypothetical protein NUV65_06950, partial [Candidatus Roizmanbacteria bacterium]|nr:hypothetical protein [Candidatus Roizmanbacteria bacterium]